MVCDDCRGESNGRPGGVGGLSGSVADRPKSVLNEGDFCEPRKMVVQLLGFSIFLSISLTFLSASRLSFSFFESLGCVNKERKDGFGKT